jgi:hypothetical protein
VSVWSRVARWAGRPDPDGEGSGEDVAADPGLASNRATGGEHDELSGDRGSVTGTGRSEVFVGRIAGDDLGYAEETGAERRAEALAEDPDPDGAPAVPPR